MNADQIEFRAGAISPGDCVSQAWNSIGPNYWFLFGVSIVAGIIAMIAGMIPVLNILLVPIITGPLFAGVYSIFRAQADGEKKDFGAMFDGFKKFGPTLIVGLILAIPGIFMQIYQLFTTIAQLMVLFGGGSMEQLANQPAFPPILIGLYIFFIVFALTVGLLLFFSLWLIMDYDLSAIEAIKLSVKGATNNLGGLIVLLLLEGLLMLAGALACLIGVLFVMPVIYLTTAIAYRQVFPGRTRATQSFEPPSPDQYRDQFGQAT